MRSTSSLVIPTLRCALLLCTPWLLTTVLSQQTPAPSLGRTIQVPLDHKNSGLGKGSLYFEFGAPFDKNKPVVFLITDGQQFYVRRGSIASLQKRIFGDDFNVVGIVGRGFSEDFTRAALDTSGEPDWLRAWQIFNSGQWVDDIELVRQAVVGRNGRILLYGGSGGATLIHEYLLKYGSHVARAFTESAAIPELNHELGIRLDRFWDEIDTHDASLQQMLLEALKRHPSERMNILIALQRQHFFVSAEKLSAARAEFIQALDKGDMSYLERVRQDYQVDAILDLYKSRTGIPISVREFELIYPTGSFQKRRADRVDPYIDSQYTFLKPLVDLADSGKIPNPGFNTSSAHQIETQVLVLAARWDEAIDYRTTIAISYSYPHHLFFIADDDHRFTKLNGVEINTPPISCRLLLVRTFLKYGLDSSELKSVLGMIEPYRWKEA
ncbi:MAG TPA: hypothetical protein VGQ39_13460 [Pyrinomonadaceae bacterium]|nr:hypothetical protein [Pyrinomonadaceae bacterium]